MDVVHIVYTGSVVPTKQRELAEPPCNIHLSVYVGYKKAIFAGANRLYFTGRFRLYPGISSSFSPNYDH
jgi:hypothetical protein